MEAALDTLIGIVEKVPYFVVGFGFLLLGKLFFDKTTTYKVDEELTERDNPAFGVCLAGYLVGVAIAIYGALQGASGDLFSDLIDVVTCSVLSIGLLRLSVVVNDMFVLYKFSVKKEIIDDRNVGAGFVVAGSCVASGLMIAGVMTGTSDSWLIMIRDIVVYWGVGQAVLILGGIVFQWITNYDIHHTIEKDDNAAAGISFGAFLAALGIITKTALTGASSNLPEEIAVTLVVSVCGIVLLSLARVIADKVFLPKGDLGYEVATQKNSAAAAIAAASFIAIALLFSATMKPQMIVAPEEPETEIVVAEEPATEAVADLTEE